MGTQTCEFPQSNPVDSEIIKLLQESKTIAIVGLSDKPERDSYRVAAYLQKHGYRIIPVNPGCAEILGEKCYPQLGAIPEKVDIVDVFRSIDAVPGIVEEALLIKPKAVWLQLGLAHNESAQKVKNTGLLMVQSKCIKIEHSRLINQ